VIVINSQIRIVANLNVCDLVVVNIGLIYLFAYYIKPNKILLFDHNFHLIQDELKLLASIHGAISLDLDLLKDVSCLHYVIVVLLGLDDHKNASSIFNLCNKTGT
jgi:hypothetical protein